MHTYQLRWTDWFGQSLNSSKIDTAKSFLYAYSNFYYLWYTSAVDVCSSFSFLISFTQNPSLATWYCSTALTKIQRPLYVKHPMMKFSWTRTEDADVVSFSFPCMVKVYMLVNFYFAWYVIFKSYTWLDDLMIVLYQIQLVQALVSFSTYFELHLLTKLTTNHHAILLYWSPVHIKFATSPPKNPSILVFFSLLLAPEFPSTLSIWLSKRSSNVSLGFQICISPCPRYFYPLPLHDYYLSWPLYQLRKS